MKVSAYNSIIDSIQSVINNTNQKDMNDVNVQIPQKIQESSYNHTQYVDNSITYDKTGKMENNVRKNTAEVITIRESVKKEVWKQIYSVFQQNMERLNGSANQENKTDNDLSTLIISKDPFGLATYFSENQEDWEKVQSGEIPDYFNVENTSKRILDIWLPHSNDEEIDIEDVRNNINKAYDEVKQMFGGTLPELVLNTQKAIMDRLNEIAEGKVA